MDILDKILPNDIVLDIGFRVHLLNMSSVLEKIKNPARVLASIVPKDSDEWIDFIDHNELDCYPVLKEYDIKWKYRMLHRVFGREVRKVIYISNNIIVGQMKWGAWFFLEIDNQACFIAEDINNFVSSLPLSVCDDLSL